MAGLLVVGDGLYMWSFQSVLVTSSKNMEDEVIGLSPSSLL